MSTEPTTPEPRQPEDCPCCGPSGPDTRPTTRREFLSSAGAGLGMLALSTLLAEEELLARESAQPLHPRGAHHAPRARSVIFLFMSGGPSHVDLFDPKPELARLHGERLPASFGMVKTRRGVEKNRLLASKRTFSRHGEAGLDFSDFIPHMASCADDLCILRGMYGDSVTHPESVYLMNTGSILMGRPSLGSWVSYGLGTENRNLPSFVVMPDPKGWVKGGSPAWGSGYLPAAHQATMLRGGGVRGGAPAIANLSPPPGAAPGAAPGDPRRTQEFIQNLNREHLRGREDDPELEARIEAYELAFRMQVHAPEAIDLGSETEATRRLYGLDRRETAGFGARCLLARRLVERGVRFVQVYCGDTNGWDAHSDIESNHRALCAESDLPVAGLLRDLKSRGLWDSTLIVWGGEFGRTPMSEGSTGRDHNPHGFTVWLAGAGVRGGQAIGSTDPLGLRAAEGRTHVHDLHATILHILGFDHLRLTYPHNGREERLTDNAGAVIRAVLA